MEYCRWVSFTYNNYYIKVGWYISPITLDEGEFAGSDFISDVLGNRMFFTRCWIISSLVYSILSLLLLLDILMLFDEYKILLLLLLLWLAADEKDMFIL